MKITLLLLLLLPLFGWGQSLQDSTYGSAMVVDSNGQNIYRYSSDRFISRLKPCDFTVNCKCYSKSDTIPVTIEIQYHKRDIPGLRDCYLINGEPWYRSTAPLTRGKWIKIRCYRWRISEGWNK